MKWLTLFAALFIIARKIDMKFSEEFLKDKEVGEVFAHDGVKWMKVSSNYAARVMSASEWLNDATVH